MLPVRNGTLSRDFHQTIDTFTKHMLMKHILYKMYTDTRYTTNIFTHATNTVTKRILYRTYTEHIHTYKFYLKTLSGGRRQSRMTMRLWLRLLI
jgi:uncharacterized protein YutE (UPF0331/DUF86 family)